MIVMKKTEENPKKQGFWKTLWPYLAQYKSKLLTCTVCALIVGVFVAVQPLVIKYIVDNGITNESLSSEEKIRLVGFLCIFYIAISFARVYIWRLGILKMLRALEGVTFRLRSKFFSHIQHMGMTFYENTSTGELFNCIMGSPVAQIKSFLQQVFISVPYQIVALIISLFALFSYDWAMTLILFMTAASMALVNKLSRKRMRRAASEFIRSEAEVSKYLNDTLNGIDAVKLHSIEDNTFKNFQDVLELLFKKSVDLSIKQQSEGIKPEIIQYIGTAVVYFVGAIACVYRGVSVGVLYAFLSSMTSILGILIAWLNIGLSKSSADSGLAKIMAVLNTTSSTPEKEESERRYVQKERANALAQNKPCIEFKNIDFSYESKKVFEGFSCSIPYGESVALVGTSGSGKSTFSKLAMRLYDVQKGQILVHGEDVRDFGIHDLRVSFGVVPQSPFIFYGSIWENVKIARPNATNKEIMDAMEIAHVHDFVNELETGWNTIVGDGGLDLSGGQKQRIAIARAVLGNPDILIFDEATSALDNISERAIQNAMETLMKSHTMIIIAHRLSTIRNVDRILVFQDGKIVEEGSYDALAAKEGGTFAELLKYNY